MFLLRAISSARSWIPVLLMPHRCLKNVVECFRSYDATEWDPNIELFESGIKLGLEIFVPALLLSLIGSVLPSSTLGETMGHPTHQVHRSIVGSFSPYTASAYLPDRSSVSIPSSSIAIEHSLLSKFDLPYLLRLITLSLISPVTVDILFHYLAPILRQSVSRLRVVLKSHKGPDASTKSSLLERERSGRVIRRHAYDLYLPPNNMDNAKSDNFIFSSLLFFPGFGVHHTAYADVASQISDHGIPVAMVSLEPLRLAHEKLGGGIDDVRRLIKLAGNDLVRYYKQQQRRKSVIDGKSTHNLYRNTIIEWSIGGHSMGGYLTFQLAKQLLRTNHDELPSVLLRDGSTSTIGPQIVVWAAGPIVQSVPNLNKADSPIPLRVLILLASKDGIAKFSSPQQKRELLSKMPIKTSLVTIKGGNHSGFASYDAANKKSNTFIINGVRDISLDSQQKKAAHQTAKFLLEK